MRVRIRFAKLGKVRWTSHRDVARMWERAFRRAGVPLAYTQGFSPRPRLSFGLALPTGAESVAEYLDAELSAGVEPDPAELVTRLGPTLPVGVDAVAAAAVAPSEPSLQQVVTSCSWVVETAGLTVAELGDAVACALAAPTLVIARERKGRQAEQDVRPGILSCVADGGVLHADLAAQPRALRPSELLVALDARLREVRVRRISQWIERDGARVEPIGLPPDATAAPHAMERAS